MEKVTKQQAEMAIAAWKDAERRKKAAEAEMKVADVDIQIYARENVMKFVDNRLTLKGGAIGIKAGVAKPIVEETGKALSTAERVALVSKLPESCVKYTIDAAALYGTDDKKIRRILHAQGVSIVRDDKYVVL